MDCFLLEQKAHEDRIDDRDRLKQDLLPRSADGRRLREIRDPDIHTDQDIHGDQKQKDREKAERLFEFCKISSYEKIQQSADNRPKRDCLGQPSVCVVKDFPVSEGGQNGTRNRNERDEQRGFFLLFPNHLTAPAVTAESIVCHSPSPCSLSPSDPVSLQSLSRGRGRSARKAPSLHPFSAAQGGAAV